MIEGSQLFGKERPAELATGALTLTRVRKILEDVVSKRSDGNLHYMNGLTLFSQSDEDNLPDKLHPNSAGYRLMGERFADLQKSFIDKIPLAIS
jgi:lysophospholipase L1-like esterase